MLAISAMSSAGVAANFCCGCCSSNNTAPNVARPALLYVDDPAVRRVRVVPMCLPPVMQHYMRYSRGPAADVILASS
jgi:hypothetical protein